MIDGIVLEIMLSIAGFSFTVLSGLILNIFLQYEKKSSLKQGLKCTADKNPLGCDLVHSRLDWPVSAVEKPNLTCVCVCMRLSDYIYRGKLTVTESY